MTRRRLGALALCLVCCDAGPGPEPAPKPEPPAPERAVEPEPPAVEPKDVEPEHVDPPVAPPVEVDLATVREAKVRVVAVHRDGSWTSCGVIHSTGVIEVEVLEVGEPPPRLALIISCPVDWGGRELLEVGKVLQVTLFAKKRSWPRPPADRKLPAELPRRYVKTLTATNPAPAPAPRSDAAPE